MQPTQELYNALDLAYQHFNQSLFNGTLPPVLFTTQRQHGVMGYFAPERWAGTAGNTCHEIAINPSYVGRAVLIEVFSNPGTRAMSLLAVLSRQAVAHRLP